MLSAGNEKLGVWQSITSNSILTREPQIIAHVVNILPPWAAFDKYDKAFKRRNDVSTLDKMLISEVTPPHDVEHDAKTHEQHVEVTTLEFVKASKINHCRSRIRSP